MWGSVRRASTSAQVRAERRGIAGHVSDTPVFGAIKLLVTAIAAEKRDVMLSLQPADSQSGACV